MIHLHNGILNSREKEGAPTFATAWMELESNMLSKLGGEGQIPYHLTFNWNLINKTNKQASKIQRKTLKQRTN